MKDQQTVDEAARAAEILLELKQMHKDRDGVGLGLLSINAQMDTLHVIREDLGKISDRADWVWSCVKSGPRFNYFKARAELFGVQFCAIFDNHNGRIEGEAEEYGCPREVLDEADADS